MSGKKPDYKIWVKAKEGDRKCNLIAIWRNDGNRLSGKFEDCVVNFTVEIDGQKYDIAPDSVWINMHEENPVYQESENEPASDGPEFPTDSIPF